MKNLLDLSGKELDAELERIAKENPPKKKFWTEKEMEIVRRLRAKGVPRKEIAEQLGRSIPSVDNLVAKSPYY